jgi:hypothetical protein
MTPQEVRNARLKSDYQEMCKIRGPVVSWQAVRGTAPYIEAYRLTINVRSIIDDEPTFRDQHVVDVEMPADYPIRVSPQFTMVSEQLVFHPNWWPLPRRDWCGGPWDFAEGLGYRVVRMIRTLQYDAVITNEDSAANYDAKLWYLDHLDDGLFPCDRQRLPNPSNRRFEIQPVLRKRFEILN